MVNRSIVKKAVSALIALPLLVAFGLGHARADDEQQAPSERTPEQVEQAIYNEFKRTNPKGVKDSEWVAVRLKRMKRGTLPLGTEFYVVGYACNFTWTDLEDECDPFWSSTKFTLDFDGWGVFTPTTQSGGFTIPNLRKLRRFKTGAFSLAFQLMEYRSAWLNKELSQPADKNGNIDLIRMAYDKYRAQTHVTTKSFAVWGNSAGAESTVAELEVDLRDDE